jgi:hypothetical protein
MKNRRIALAATAGLCAVAAIGGVVSLLSAKDEAGSSFILSGNYDCITAFADEQSAETSGSTETVETSNSAATVITTTKYLMSTNNEYMLLVTAFDYEAVKDTASLVGYIINGKEDSSNIYYSAIVFSSEASKNAEDIFGEQAANYGLIVTEMKYDAKTDYTYNAFISGVDGNGKKIIAENQKKNTAAGSRLTVTLKDGVSELYATYNAKTAAWEINWADYVTFNKDGVEVYSKVLSGENVSFKFKANGLTATYTFDVWYAIDSIESFMAISNELSGNYKLVDDIDFDGKTIEQPLGESFSGTLDGNGKKISNLNLTINGSGSALFIDLGKGGVLRNLAFINVNATFWETSAFLVVNNYGTIENCLVQGNVTVEKNFVGGIVYSNEAGGTISNCIFAGKVTQNEEGFIGGIACYNKNDANIKNSVFINTDSSGSSDGEDATYCVGTTTGESSGGIDPETNSAISWGCVNDSNYAGYNISELYYTWLKGYIVT